MKLGTNIRHVNGHCWKGFQGQRSDQLTHSSGGQPFDGAASSLACFVSFFGRRPALDKISAAAKLILYSLKRWRCFYDASRLLIKSRRRKPTRPPSAGVVFVLIFCRRTAVLRWFTSFIDPYRSSDCAYLFLCMFISPSACQLFIPLVLLPSYFSFISALSVHRLLFSENELSALSGCGFCVERWRHSDVIELPPSIIRC